MHPWALQHNFWLVLSSNSSSCCPSVVLSACSSKSLLACLFGSQLGGRLSAWRPPYSGGGAAVRAVGVRTPRSDAARPRLPLLPRVCSWVRACVCVGELVGEERTSEWSSRGGKCERLGRWAGRRVNKLHRDRGSRAGFAFSHRRGRKIRWAKRYHSW